MKTAIVTDVHRWVTVAFLSFLTAALMVSIASAGEVTVGKTAPDFTARSVTGQTFQLSQQQGQTVLLTFWSNWCTLNREELTFLRQLEDRFPELVFVIVDAGSVQPSIKSLAQVWRTAEEWALHAVVLPDKGLQLTNLYGVGALPTSLVVGADGKIAHIEPNFFWPDQERVTKSLEKSHSVTRLYHSVDGGVE